MKKILNVINSLLLYMGILFLLNGCKENDEENPSNLSIITIVDDASISVNSAISGGNVINNKGFTIIQRGVCWSTNSDPTINDSITIDGSGTGTFVSTIRNLLPGTRYYVRAYAKSDQEVTYGNSIIITTLFVKLLTSNNYNALLNTAMCTGSISDSGGYAILRRGICWTKKNASPTVNDSFINSLKNSATFTCKISGLTGKTTYYIRPFAETSKGIGYGDKLAINTIDSVLLDTDNNSYKLVQIGNQVWMAENLKVTQYSNMIPVQLIYSADVWDKLTINNKAYCFYDDNISYKNNYGCLYTWVAAMNGSVSSSSYPSGVQGICPVGWHLPSLAEWDTLIRNAGGINDAGGKLKQTGTTFWATTNALVTNEYRFSARACGQRDNNGIFSDKLVHGQWWTSSEYNAINALSRLIDRDNHIFTYSPGKDYGLSVRCVRN